MTARGYDMTGQLIQPKVTITIPGLDQAVQRAVFLEGLQWGVIVGLVVGVLAARLWDRLGR